MQQYLLVLVSAVVMLLLDFLYLTLFKSFFGGIVKRVQGGTPLNFRLVGAILCYVFLIFGLNYFILQDKSGRRPWTDAFLLGLVIYGVYETTSYTLFQDWPWSAVVLDTLWGGSLFALTTVFTRAILMR